MTVDNPNDGNGELHSPRETSNVTDDMVKNSLRRRFSPPAVPKRLLAAIEESAPTQPATKPPTPSRISAGPRVSGWKLISAVGVCAVCVANLVYQAWPEPSTYLVVEPAAPRPLTELYRERVAAGFEPDWLCEDDAQFQHTFDYRYGQALTLADLPPQTEMLGIAYFGTLTGILGTAEGEPVITFVSGQHAMQDDLIEEDGRLNIHKANIAGLNVYEVSPLKFPRLTEGLHPGDNEATKQTDDSDKLTAEECDECQ